MRSGGWRRPEPSAYSGRSRVCLSDRIGRREVLGNLGDIFEMPHQLTRPYIVYDPLHPLELRRSHCADVLRLEEEQARRTRLVVELEIERRDAVAKQSRSSFECGSCFVGGQAEDKRERCRK